MNDHGNDFCNLVVKHQGREKPADILIGNDFTRVKVVGSDVFFPQGDDTIRALNKCGDSEDWRDNMST